jgi:predicted O-methyltransferase YrrM
MNFFRARNYLKYIILSRHEKGHGIHSPFVFDIVSRLFRNKIDPVIVNKIEMVRKRLLNESRSIEVLDLGSGSKKMKSNIRKVSDIARYSPVNQKYGILLSNLAAEFGKTGVVEFGTSFGISTMYMAASVPESVVYTMEGSPAVAGIADNNFSAEGFGNINLLTGPFSEMLPKISDSGIKPGLVFIDGNHRREPVLEYFNKMLEISDSDTVIVIDDINNSAEMADAWNEIRNNKSVTCTIDIFRMGIVFLKNGITPQHYIIRH